MLSQWRPILWGMALKALDNANQTSSCRLRLTYKDIFIRFSLLQETHVQLAVHTSVSALKAIAEPTRLRLLVLLSSGELNVKDLTGILGQSQPRISRHLKLLAEAGIV